MIRLVVITDSPPTMTRCFDQSIVTIGADTSPHADFSLPGETLQDRHVQILNEKNRFYVVNIANDPFVTLNGQPFGKKSINHRDIIQIGNTAIRFECELTKDNSFDVNPPICVNSNRKPLKDENHDFLNNDFSRLVDTREILPIILDETIAGKTNNPLDPPFSKISNINDVPESENPPSFKQDPDYESYFNEWDEIRSKNSPLSWDDQQLDPLDIEELVRQVEELAAIDEVSTPPVNLDQDNVENQNEIKEILPNTIQYLNSNELSKETLHQEPHPLAQRLATADIETVKQSLASSPNPPIPSPKLSLKDYYLSEYDDVSETSNISTSNNSSQTFKEVLFARNWKLYLKIFISLLGIAIIAAGLAYLWISDQSDKEEIQASKGVADVAMALTYAQIKHIRPQNQSWSDPEFIKNNLPAVLASKYSSLADFDTHGQFLNCPYMLRIYTSGDLSQFLVIAQPAPSLLQWLIPKTTIIIDSRAMEMRKIKDLKLLNRLLVNANTLDGASAGEVSNLIRQGELIPLANLIDKSENLGFSPPKALALIRPGAENLVYNAPRYYPLGEDFLKKSLELIEKPASSHEVAILQQELTSLSKFPNTLLYSSGGIQNAIQAQKALATLSPKEKFLIAYIQLNNKGLVANSHLLMDDTPTDVAYFEATRTPSNRHKNHDSESIDIHSTAFLNNNANTPQQTNLIDDVDEDNPLFLQLSALNVFRQQVLRPISEEMISLLNKETQSAQPDFASRLQQLFTKYLEVNEEQQAKIGRKIDVIYRENSHLPASQFLNLSKAAALEESLKEYLSLLKKQLVTPEITQEQMEKRLQKIEKASNWLDLEQEIAETIEILNLERIPEEDRLVAYQNATRSRVIQKLNQFLLSSEHSLPTQAFDSEYRYTLINILKMGWITDPDTSDFYLSEFDLRTNPRDFTRDEDE